jgi:hypothetical protein
MADPLHWNRGEGYDIHVLRGGPPSKSLVSALRMPAGAVAGTLKFTPQFVGAPSNFGVVVDTATGVVSASPPPPNQSRTEINNFLMTISVEDNNAKKFESEIRIHVHNTVTAIWLTPETLNAYKGTDECQFTVLARFNGGVTGDITGWSQLTYSSIDPVSSSPSADVQVTSTGILKVINPGKSARIEVTLVVSIFPNPLPLKRTASATVFAQPSWAELGAKADVRFMAEGLRLIRKSDTQKDGTVVPNPSDPSSSKRDSVASVVANAANILFVAEGFTKEADFKDLVVKAVEDFRTQDHMQPFKIVQDSVNYWSVFLPSRGNGVTLLGEYANYAFSGPPPFWTGNFLNKPTKPSPSATDWSIEDMVHEVGLPTSDDPTDLDAFKPLWDLRYGVRDYKKLCAKSFKPWRTMGVQATSFRSVINESDTPFGIKNADRPRVADFASTVHMGWDPRRSSDQSFFKFIEALNFGLGPGGSKFNLGSVWKSGGKDFGFVCFLCNSQKQGGTAAGSHFVSSTSRGDSVKLRVRLTAGGTAALELDTPPIAAWDRAVFPSVIVHEFGHIIKLGDEYGDGGGKQLSGIAGQPNLLSKSVITSIINIPPMVPSVVYDKTSEIKWLWPRITKAGMIAGKPVPSGNRLKVPLRKTHGKAFVFGDIVRIRETPVLESPSVDPFGKFGVGFSLSVTAHDDDSVTIALGPSGGTTVIDVTQPVPGSSDTRGWGDVLISMLKPDKKYVVICPRRKPGLGGGTELKLVSEVIRNQIAASNAPLNAPAGNEGVGHETVACKALGGNGGAPMTATNLPAQFSAPFSIATLRDIIGIYEGGGFHDCGIFRPAGRCKMRETDTDPTIPFCHVCRYIIVDRLDPTKHGELDDLYEPTYPK